MRITNSVKRALCLMLIAAVLVLTAAPAFAASKASGAYVVTNTNGERLIVHDSPWGSEVTRLKPGTVVVYKSKKSGWWKVEYNGGSGYVDPRYLTSVTSLSYAKYRSVKTLPVYSKAKSSSTYLGKLKTSMKVSITKKSGSWVCVTRNGYSGWVLAKYLRRVS